jgi:PKHD-type hydroxylase
MIHFSFDREDDNSSWIIESTQKLDSMTLSKIEFYVQSHKDQLFDGRTVDPRGNDGSLELRSSRIMWLAEDKKFDYLYKEMANILTKINDHCYKYSLYGFESFQYSEYPAEDNGHYTWHIDTSVRGGQQHVRKLSFSAGLNDESEYEGGELEFWLGPEKISYRIKKGQIIVFPSYLLHRVAPVTKGVRKTLVGWSRGPNFV